MRKPAKIQAWINKKISEEQRKKQLPIETEVYSTIIVAEDPKATLATPHVRVDATCPCCRKHLNIVFPKKTVKALTKALKVGLGGNQRNAMLQPIMGHPKTGSRPKLKRIIE